MNILIVDNMHPPRLITAEYFRYNFQYTTAPRIITAEYFRYNSQYTTLQDSLYNKYALSVLPGRVNSPSKPAVGDNSEQHLALVRRLLTFQVVETLVPWLYCVYPPITVSSSTNY